MYEIDEIRCSRGEEGKDELEVRSGNVNLGSDVPVHDDEHDALFLVLDVVDIEHCFHDDLFQELVLPH